MGGGSDCWESCPTDVALYNNECAMLNYAEITPVALFIPPTIQSAVCQALRQVLETQCEQNRHGFPHPSHGLTLEWARPSLIK